MTTGQLLLTAWDFQPSVVGGCLALLALYAVAWRRTARLPRAAACAAPRSAALPGNVPCEQERPGLRYRPPLFVAGVLVLLLALVSPLDTLGDTYLFSAHMAQHMLLLQVVPPLLLLGMPSRLWRRIVAWPPADRLERFLGRPLLAWPIGVITLWAWHAPALYNAALGNENLHTFQHLTFLVAATIFWWPVVAPLRERRRLPSWAAVGYLMLGALSSSILGIILTFSPADIYPGYLHPVDSLGILPLVWGQWGLTPAADERLGGGLMWVAGGLIYLLAIVLTVARWFGDLDEAADADDEMPVVEPTPAVIRS
jgi:putative membrane protein